MVPAPASTEINALRLALDDRQLRHIDPHITIVPPINLRDEAVAEAMAIVDAAAARCGPCELALGPVETFGADSPVRYLRVDPWAPVEAIHRACWTGVLERRRERPFVPHVTIDIDGSPADDPDPALDLLAGYRCVVDIDSVTLLEEHRREVAGESFRRWEPFAHYRLTG